MHLLCLGSNAKRLSLAIWTLWFFLLQSVDLRGLRGWWCYEIPKESAHKCFAHFYQESFLENVRRKFKRKNDYPVILRILGFFSSSFGRKIHHPRFQDRQKRRSSWWSFWGVIFFPRGFADFELTDRMLFRWAWTVWACPMLTPENRAPAKIFRRYCWWFRSQTHLLRLVVYPTILRGIAGSLPSTVCYLPGG